MGRKELDWRGAGLEKRRPDSVRDGKLIIHGTDNCSTTEPIVDLSVRFQDTFPHPLILAQQAAVVFRRMIPACKYNSRE